MTPRCLRSLTEMLPVRCNSSFMNFWNGRGNIPRSAVRSPSTGKQSPTCLTLDGAIIGRMKTHKLLGVHFSDDLKWSICSRAASQTHCSPFQSNNIRVNYCDLIVYNKTSTILKSNAGTPQGTIAGPNDFKLFINDLLFDINNA